MVSFLSLFPSISGMDLKGGECVNVRGIASNYALYMLMYITDMVIMDKGGRGGGDDIYIHKPQYIYIHKPKQQNNQHYKSPLEAKICWG